MEVCRISAYVASELIPPFRGQESSDDLTLAKDSNEDGLSRSGQPKSHRRFCLKRRGSPPSPP